jgi:ankyrin repeat protein
MRKYEIAELLIKKGADVNKLGTYSTYSSISQTPLHIAVYNHDTKMVNLLLHYNADVDLENNKNGIDDINDTPLYIAVMHNMNDIVNLMIQHTANIDKLDKSGNSLLYNAVYNDYYDIVNTLLNNGAKISDDLRELCIALKKKIAPYANTPYTIAILLLDRIENIPESIDCDDILGHVVGQLNLQNIRMCNTIIELLIAKNAKVNVNVYYDNKSKNVRPIQDIINTQLFDNLSLGAIKTIIDAVEEKHRNVDPLNRSINGQSDEPYNVPSDRTELINLLQDNKLKFTVIT